MADCSSLKPQNLSQENESIYLSLVDMFVDVVEPAIVLMVLQNRNWDLEAAVEDIMILSNTPAHERPQQIVHASDNGSWCSTETGNCSNKAPSNADFIPMNMAASAGRALSKSKSLNEVNSKRDRAKTNGSNNLTSMKQGNDNTKQNPFGVLPSLDNYNLIKTIPVAYERSLTLIKSGIKLMVILRGPPGSGKSHLSKKLLNDAGIDHSRHKRHIFSSDDFFLQNGVYVFAPERLGEAHEWNRCNVKYAVKDEVSPILIDNTNLQAWEMQVYAKLAVSAGYDLELLEPDNWWSFKESELSKRNIHGVPKHKIRIMIERYEKNITPNKLLSQFDLHYTLNNAPPQPVRSKSRKDKLSSYRNNRPKKKKSGISPQSNVHPDTTFSDVNTSNFDSALPFQLPKLSSNCFTAQSVNFNDSDLKLFSYNNTNSAKENKPVPIASYKCKPENVNETGYSVSSGFNFNLGTSRSVGGKMVSNNLANTDSVENKVDYLIPESLSKHEETKNPSVLSGPNDKSRQNSFDFMAESNKLLLALGRSTPPNKGGLNTEKGFEGGLCFSAESKEIQKSSSEAPKLYIGENVVNSDLQDQFLYFETQPLCVPEICETNNKLDGIFVKENTLYAETLIDSILDKVCDSKGNNVEENQCTNEHEKCSGNCADSNEERDMWDYVLVNDDNTFVYKKSNYTPIPPFHCGTNNSTLFVETLNEMDITSSDRDLETGFSDESFLKNKVFSGNCVEGTIPSCHSNSNDSSQALSSDKNLEELAARNKIGNLENLDVNSRKLRLHQAIMDGCQLSDESDVFTKVLEKGKIVTEKVGNESSSASIESSKSNNTDMMKTNSSNDLISNHMLQNGWEEEDVVTEAVDLKTNLPKPPRNLNRSRFPMSSEPLFQQVATQNLNGWDTVPNPYEAWNFGENCNLVKAKKVEPVSLPQRVKSNKSTNTNYLDFLQINDSNDSDVKVLKGCCRPITDGSHSSEKYVAEMLLLDKSTMTSESTMESEKNLDLQEIGILFPEIPKQYVLDVVDKCHGDIDWAVNLLFDSEHNMFPGVDSNFEITEQIREQYSESENTTGEPDYQETSQENQPIQRDPIERSELKKFLESTVVFNKSHYSDNVLKVMKKKNPEYFNMIESESNHAAMSEDSEKPEIPTLDQVKEIESVSSRSSSDEGSSNVKSDSEEKTDDDDVVELAISSEVIFQLQQKFGNPRTPNIINPTPVVKLPVSLAREVYGYIMDSIQSEMDEQQELIENMIANDEEIAKLLQYQDEGRKESLQEIMDLEVALAVHRADQEEWKEKSNDTVAARLSKNILLEKFPQADPKVLMEMLHTHNYSLHDTVASLNLAFDTPDTAPAPALDVSEKAVVASSSAVDSGSVGGETVDPVSEAQSHRQEAATYYSMRIECLRKAQEAFRSGNKQVASFYSHLAQVHKKEIERCHQQAASCLLATHTQRAGHTLDLHFLLVPEAAVVVDMFLDGTVARLHERGKRYQTVFLITGRGLRSAGGVSRIKPMVLRKLHARKIKYNEVNPGMLSALITAGTPLSCVL